MNDLWAKVTLATICIGAIIGAVILKEGQVALLLVSLASGCAGAIGGVAIQGAMTNNSVTVAKPDDPPVV